MTDHGQLLYDPDCGFCTRSANWLVARGMRATATPLGPWAAALGVDLERGQREVPFVRPDGRITWGARAIADGLATCRGPLRFLGGILALAPIQALARPVYRWVAEHRHELPGGTAQCKLPPR